MMTENYSGLTRTVRSMEMSRIMYNTPEDKQILYSRGGSFLDIIDGRKYKCRRCWVIISGEHLEDGKCPVCGSDQDLMLMCEQDHTCNCIGEVHAGIQYCSICGEAICPCGSHDVATISRVTGYLAEVSGWNLGKQQEYKDRVRYTIS